MVKARKSAGLTQQELAKRLHKPQSFVAKFEGGAARGVRNDLQGDRIRPCQTFAGASQGAIGDLHRCAANL